MTTHYTATNLWQTRIQLRNQIKQLEIALARLNKPIRLTTPDSTATREELIAELRRLCLQAATVTIDWLTTTRNLSIPEAVATQSA